MFDTYKTSHETKVCPVTRVIEQIISPDKVTELYMQVKEEVYGQIINTYLIKTDTLNAVVFESWVDAMEMKKNIRYAFKVNDELVKGKMKLEDEKFLENGEIVRVIFERFTQEIARQIITSQLPKLLKL